MVDTELPYTNAGMSGLVEAEGTSTPAIFKSFMSIAGRTLNLLKEDLRSLRTRAEFLALDFNIILNHIFNPTKRRRTPTFSPAMPLFAPVTAALVMMPATQSDQPVEALIDCVEAVENGDYILHPDGGTSNGSFYCVIPQTQEIHPGFLTCAYAEKVGGTIGTGPHKCWDTNPIDGLNIKPFTPPVEGITNPAPLLPPATPTPPVVVEPSATTESRPRISLDNMDERGKNALKVSLLALIAAGALFLTGIGWSLSRGGKGTGSYKVSSYQPPTSDKDPVP